MRLLVQNPAKYSCISADLEALLLMLLSVDMTLLTGQVEKLALKSVRAM